MAIQTPEVGLSTVQLPLGSHLPLSHGLYNLERLWHVHYIIVVRFVKGEQRIGELRYGHSVLACQKTCYPKYDVRYFLSHGFLRQSKGKDKKKRCKVNYAVTLFNKITTRLILPCGVGLTA